ncbi:helix-turn-helix transcriptional regulator [Kribbella sp. NPDC006257]|uniref:helix-turn-helix transcriptional regulator n=1 Tax=Kribbella sp. NPDC006257 TaxID=3156738 RepID=UPI0033A83603
MRHGVAPSDLGEQISRAIDPWVRHDALRLSGLSPSMGMGLAAFSFWHGHETALGQALVRDSHLTANFRSRGGAAFADTVAGISAPHREDTSWQLLSNYGLGSELRLLLRDSRGVWGSVGLARSQEKQPFQRDDLRRADRLVPTLIGALRRYVTTGPLTPMVSALPAGVIVIGPDHGVKAISTEARDWIQLAWLPKHHRLPDWIAVAAAERLSIDTQAHLRDPRAWRPRVYAPPTSVGRWITLHGQALDEDGTGDVAIIVQAASGALLIPTFCDWYGITARERQVLESLSTGRASKEIARQLGVAVSTINDHLKAMFRKTGAHGRDELLAAITN